MHKQKIQGIEIDVMNDEHGKMSTSISITVYSKCEPENSVGTPISFKKLRIQNL